MMRFGSNYNNAPGQSTIITLLGNIVLVLFVVCVALFIIHYTVTPIITTSKGKGFITIPGIGNTGQVYWPKPTHESTLSEAGTPINGKSHSYTLAADFTFNDFNNGANDLNARPLLLRYNAAQKSTPTFGIYLDPAVNDINVLVRTADMNIETIKVRNIVAKVPVRITVVVGPNYFEVYKNGLLVGTRNLSTYPIASIGTIWSDMDTMPPTPPSPSKCNPAPAGPLGQSQNLHLWDCVLTAGEVRVAGPEMPASIQ
jgi:hypothetical protein